MVKLLVKLCKDTSKAVATLRRLRYGHQTSGRMIKCLTWPKAEYGKIGSCFVKCRIIVLYLLAFGRLMLLAFAVCLFVCVCLMCCVSGSANKDQNL